MNGSVNVPGVSGADLARIESKANKAASDASAALTAASSAQTAASKAQTAADAALKAVEGFAFTINTIPSQNGTLTYNGSEQSPTWNSFNPDALTLGGVTKGTDAGEYVATFTPKEGYKWSDETTDAKEVTWSIGRATIAAVPAQSGALTYTGSAQSPSWSNYDAEKMTLGGTTSGTNAGSYAATFTPKSNYQWSGGETTAKTVNWSIGKAAGSLSLNKSSLTLNNTTKTSTITVTRAGDGAITATSGDTGIATVSVSGTTITVTAKAYGTTTITVKVAAGTNHNAPGNKTCSVTVNLFNESMASNTWAAIKAASDSGDAANVWSVGDTKNIKLNGKVGNFTFSNLSVDAFIVGFNHNSSKEGGNRIHFAIGKIGGKMVALCDSQYNNEQTTTGYFNMNTSRSNSGGWNASYMRKTLLGNSGTPSSPPANSLLAALPSDLRAIMKSVTKYTDNTGNASNTAGAVTATTDWLWLFAEFEVQGSRSWANQYEQNSQKQYDYFKSGNSKVAYKHSSTGTAVWWWLRSATYDSNHAFCAVYTDGGDASSSASWRPAFWPALLPNPPQSYPASIPPTKVGGSPDRSTSSDGGQKNKSARSADAIFENWPPAFFVKVLSFDRLVSAYKRRE